MGGGGSRYFSEDDAKSAIEQLQEVEETTAKRQLNSDLAELLSGMLADFEDRQRNLASLTPVRDILRNIAAELVESYLGGLVRGYGGADGITDSDFVLIFDDCDLNDREPENARHEILGRLESHFGGSQVKDNGIVFAVRTAGFDSIVLVAVRCRNVTRIPTVDGWVMADPLEFSAALQKANREFNGRAVEALKIAKAICSKLPERQRPRSLHVEWLGLDVLGKYRGVGTIKNMLEALFSEAQHLVLSGIIDADGQRLPIDNYLGEPESPERGLVANAMGRISRRMKNADSATSLDQWRAILLD